MKVIRAKVEGLAHDPSNARLHGEKNLAAIRASLEAFGQVKPLVVHRGVVVAGNGTLEAARGLGWDRVSVVELPEDWPAERVQAYALADNRTAELASWDDGVVEEQLRELDAAGWDVTGLGFDAPPPPPPELGDLDDFSAELPAEPSARVGDVYRLGDHRLVCGDATDPLMVAAALGGREADLVWTDPPYGVDVQGRDLAQRDLQGRRKDGLGVLNDNLDPDSLEAMLRGAFSAAYDGCRAGAVWYVAGPAGDLGLLFQQALFDLGLFRHALVWAKDSMVMGRADYHYQHEQIFYGWKEGAGHSWYSDRKQTTLLHFDRPKRSKQHPTMKPVALIEYCLTNSSKPFDTVLDMFGGSGSTLMACHALGRTASLIELDPAYVDVINQRFHEATGIEPVKE